MDTNRVTTIIVTIMLLGMFPFPIGAWHISPVRQIIKSPSNNFVMTRAFYPCLHNRGQSQETRFSTFSATAKESNEQILEYDDDDDDDYEEEEEDSFGTSSLTPNQIKFLRKESSKRLARRGMPQIWVSDDYSNLNDIAQAFSKTHELIQVRGIAKDDATVVYATSEQIAYEMTALLQKPVEVVQVKGHSCILFCPMEGIVLRSSYKEGQWEKRIKAPRNIYGQIIREDS